MMMKQWKREKKSVELTGEARVSRIRRDPAHVPPPEDGKGVWWRTDEWEIKLAVVGIIAFAIAINIITFAISAYTE